MILTFLTHPLKPINLLIASLIGIGFIHYSFQYAILRQWDFFVYYLASHAAVTGLNIYDPEILKVLGNSLLGVNYGGLPYLYSPFVAWLIYPVTLFPPYTAAFIWLLLKCIALEMVILLSLKLLRLPNSILWLGIAHLLCVCFRPFGLDVNSGNVAIFESMLVLVFFYGLSVEKNFLAAIALWISIIFKSFPFLLILYPIHFRKWNFIYYFTGLGTIFLMLSIVFWKTFANWMQYFRSDAWKMMWDEQVQSYYNCSSTTVILRTFSDTYFAEPLINSNWAVLILIPLFPICIFLMTLYALKKYLANNNVDLYSAEVISLIICTLLLLSPRLAGYTLAWLYFPLLTSIVASISKRNITSVIMSVFAIILIQITIAPEHVPAGILQLLIDKEFFGLLLVYISVFSLVIKNM